MNDPISFGDWLKRQRRALDLTQKELAQQVGYSVATIRKIEANKRRPSKQAAVRLAACLGFDEEQTDAFVVFARTQPHTPGLAPPLPDLGREHSWQRALSQVKNAASQRLKTAPNLLQQVTRFVGREVELRSLNAMLLDPAVRLVTVTGPGGIGKTSLALAAATAQTSHFQQGTAFVPLAGVDPAIYMGTINPLVASLADALGYAFHGGVEPVSQLLAYLGQKELLLLIDNFEPLLDDARYAETAEFLTRLLATVPSVKLLITSRERLLLQEEWLLPLQGLSFPDDRPDRTVEPTEFDAVVLFRERARRVVPTFDLETSLAAVVRICQLVEGMPLALELAADWVRLMPCEAIAREIEDGLDLLTTSLRNVPQRHHSMWTVFEQTWKRLTTNEKAAVRQLSAFSGSFSLAAVEAVGSSLATLAALVDKSLLHRASAQRYRLHELLRQYANGKLRQRLAEAAAVQEEHGSYYLLLLRQQEERMKGPEFTEARASIQTDIDNVRAAWHWAIEHHKWADLMAAMEGLWLFYDAQSWFLEGEHAFATAVDALRQHLNQPASAEVTLSIDETKLALGLALSFRGAFLNRLGLIEQAKVAGEEGLALVRAAGRFARRETALALYFLTDAFWFLDEIVTAQNLITESYILFEEVKDNWGRGNSLMVRGLLAWTLGQYAQAEQLLRNSISILEVQGEQFVIVYAFNGMGRVATASGRFAEAETWYEQSFQRRLALGDRQGIAYTLNDLGDLARIQGIETLSEGFYRQSQTIAREIAIQGMLAKTMRGLSQLAERSGDYERAKQLILDSKPLKGTFESDLFLGWAEFGLGDHRTAERHFHRVLQLSTRKRLTPIILAALTGLAYVLWKKGEPEQALETLAQILDHPATTHETKARASQLRDELILEAPAGVEPAVEAPDRRLELPGIARSMRVLAEFHDTVSHTTPLKQA